MKADIEKATTLYQQNMVFGDIMELCNLSISQMRTIEIGVKRSGAVWQIKKACQAANDEMKTADIEGLFN